MKRIFFDTIWQFPTPENVAMAKRLLHGFDNADVDRCQRTSWVGAAWVAAFEVSASFFTTFTTY